MQTPLRSSQWLLRKTETEKRDRGEREGERGSLVLVWR